MDDESSTGHSFNELTQTSSTNERPLSPILTSGVKFRKKSLHKRRSRSSHDKRTKSLIATSVTNENSTKTERTDDESYLDLPNIENTVNKESTESNYKKLKLLQELEEQRSNICNLFYDSRRDAATNEEINYQFKIPRSTPKKSKSRNNREEPKDSYNEAGDFLPLSDNFSYVEGDNHNYFMTASGKALPIPSNYHNFGNELFRDILSDTTLENTNQPCMVEESSELETNRYSEEDISERNIISVANSLMKELSKHIKMEIEGLEDVKTVRDSSFVDKAKAYINELDDTLDLSEYPSYLTNTFGTATSLPEDEEDVCCDSSTPNVNENTSQQMSTADCLTDSLTDFYGFTKEDRDYSRKILNLCNTMVESVMNKKVGQLRNCKSEPVKVDEKFFQVQQFNKIIEYCKDKIISSYEEVKDSRRSPPEQKFQNMAKRIKLEENCTKERPSTPKLFLLDKIEEVNESNSSGSYTFTDKVMIDFSKKSESLPDDFTSGADLEYNIPENNKLLTGFKNSVKIFDELTKIVNSMGKTDSANIKPEITVECQTSNASQDVKSVEVDSKDHFQKCVEIPKSPPPSAKVVKSYPERGFNISEEAIKKMKSQLKKPSETIRNNVTSPKKQLESSRPKSPTKNEIAKCMPKSPVKKDITNCDDQIEKTLRNDLENFKAGIEKSKKLFKEIKELYSTVESPSKLVDFKTASDKPLSISETALSKSKAIFDDDCKVVYDSPENKNSSDLNVLFMTENENFNEKIGFKMASGKEIKIDDAESLIKSKEIFKKDSLITDNDNSLTNIEFKKASRNAKSLQISKENFKDRFENSNKSFPNVGFRKASGKDIKIDDKSLQKSKEIFKDVEFRNENNSFINVGFKKASGKEIEINEESLQKSREIFKGDEFETTTSKLPLGSFLPEKCALENNATPPKESTLTNANNRGSGKKRLGLKPCKQIVISEHKVEKMKQLFENLYDTKGSPESPLNTTLKTPKVVEKIDALAFEKGDYVLTSSTPVKSSITSRTIRSVLDVEKNQSPNSAENVEIYSGGNQLNCRKSVIFWKRDTSDVHPSTDKINEELRLHEIRINVLNERRNGLREQIGILEDVNSPLRRPQLGILTKLKKESKRISLRDILELNESGEKQTKISGELFEISAKNAEHVHFYCPWQNECVDNSVLSTLDGAIIVPNIEDYVGLVEMKLSFETTPGVDPRLVPRGWIANHYKLIVWKLASLERKFSKVYGNCLNVENIMQQLKYRYDKEIDKSERSCLRRILEKDDTSVKRMVLLVSDVIKIAYNKHELELSDGWYTVRASIDVPLNSLVLKRRIVTGIKIITQSAELSNCEGCHPLQQTDLVKLNISYNCTRPAHWDSKLGFQTVCSPFPIPLSTLHVEGGTIACTKLLIIRVYPSRFIEKKSGSTIVWRNKKAEDKEANEWEKKQYETIEELSYRMQREFENEIKQEEKKAKMSTTAKLNVSELSKIFCPKTLLIMQRCAFDPDTFKERLSTAQQKLLLDYNQKICDERQQELQSRIKKELIKQKLSRRDVTQVLKLSVFDSYDKSSDKVHVLNVWKPNEEHLEMIKEGRTFLVYNVLPKKNGDLSSTCRTKFGLVNEENAVRFDNVKRKVMAIAELNHTTAGKTLLGEFDTVGTIVRIKISEDEQELWLTDPNFKLLFIKIVEGPKRCCLLDSVKVGQSVAIWNLIAFGLEDKVAQAVANQYTLISSYPNAHYLKEALKEHNERIKDASALVKEADIIVEERIVRSELFENKNYKKPLYSSISINASEIFNESSEEDCFITDGLTRTDVAMSLINTENLI